MQPLAIAERGNLEPQRNRAAHKRMLDAQMLGLLVSRAAAEGVEAEGFEVFKVFTTTYAGLIVSVRCLRLWTIIPRHQLV